MIATYQAAIAAIVAALNDVPIADRAEVLEIAYGESIPDAVADGFKADFATDTFIPVLLVSGEIAADVMHRYEDQT